MGLGISTARSTGRFVFGFHFFLFYRFERERSVDFGSEKYFQYLRVLFVLSMCNDFFGCVT